MYRDSAFPRAYDQWLEEATKIVDEYGYSDQSDDPVIREEPYFFSRGEPGKPEDSWRALQRLADEVNWRCFVVSKTVYFMSENRLIRSSVRAEVNDRTPGVIRISADFDSGKKLGEVEVIAQIGRWAAPPGTVVRLTDLGPLNGRWFVDTVERNLFETDGTITLTQAASEAARTSS